MPPPCRETGLPASGGTAAPRVPLLRSWPPGPRNGTVLGDEAFKEGFMLRWGRTGAPTQHDRCPRKRRLGRGRTAGRPREGAGRRRPSTRRGPGPGRNQPVYTWTSDSRLRGRGTQTCVPARQTATRLAAVSRRALQVGRLALRILAHLCRALAVHGPQWPRLGRAATRPRSLWSTPWRGAQARRPGDSGGGRKQKAGRGGEL